MLKKKKNETSDNFDAEQNITLINSGAYVRGVEGLGGALRGSNFHPIGFFLFFFKIK